MDAIDYEPFAIRVRRSSPADDLVDLGPDLSEAWIGAYRRAFGRCEPVWVGLDTFEYIFDLADHRVLGAYGVMNGPHAGPRDSKRARSPFSYNGKVQNVGHIMPHSGGGRLDINLFLQLAKVNNGPFKSLEIKAVRNKGSFYFVRLLYASDSDRPSSLEQGLAIPGPPPEWWDARFAN